MTVPRQLGIVRSYSDLHGILRRRAEELGLSREVIDEISGMQPGYAAKLLAPMPLRRIGEKTMALILPALAIKLVAQEDEEWLQKIKQRGYRRNASCAQHAGTVVITFSRRHMRKIQLKGGQNSRKYMTKSHARKLARRAGKASARARWSKASTPLAARSG